MPLPSYIKPKPKPSPNSTHQADNPFFLSLYMGIRNVDIAGQTITIHELDDICDSVSGCAYTGSWLWDSALALSNWLATSNIDFKGKSVLELGAGTGLPGLTAAKLGASLVILTDVAPLLPGLLKNVEENGLGNQVEVRELVWGAENHQLVSEKGTQFDVVLMSDVFYDRDQMEALGSTLKGVCGEEGRVLAASEVRPWTTECLNELASLGFGVVELEMMRGLEGEGGEDGEVLLAMYCLNPPKRENC